MKKQLTLIGAVFFLISCSSTQQVSKGAKQEVNDQVSKDVKQELKDDNTFIVNEISTDKSYGLSPKNPVEVGGVKNSEGPLNERRYLNALTGPNGEKISYYRQGSCCPVKSENGLMGTALLDNYRVTWENSKDTVSIYINMYDSGILKAPVGFGIKK